MFIGLKRASDSRIVQRVLGGQQEAYAYLVERYMPSVQALVQGGPVYSADVEDVTQETFLRAYQKLDTLQQPERFGPWLMAIARNTALSWARRYRNPSPLTDEMADKHLVTEPPVQQEDRERVLREALGRLDEKSQEILKLHYLAGNSLKEIAVLLEISRDAAAKRLQRAREALGAEMLSAFPEYAPTAAKVSARTKTIMAAVAASGAAWEASAQAGAGGAAAGLGGTLIGGKAGGVIGTGVIAVLALLALFRFDVIAGWLADPPPEQAELVVEEPPAEPEMPMAENMVMAATEEGEAEPETGNGSVSAIYATQAGEPAVGATVFLEKVTWEPWEYPPDDTFKKTGTTDEGGKVLFEGLPMGEYGGVAMGNSMGGSEDWNIRKDYPESHKRSTLMMAIVPFAGRVVDAAGKPVAEAIVYPITHQAFPEDEFRHRLVVPLRGKTDAEGHFKLKGLWPGGWKFFIVMKDGRLHKTDFIEAPAEDAELVVPPAPKVTGQVVADRDGLALGGLTLNFTQGQRIRYEVQTDGEGNFEIPAIGVGEYRVSLDDPALTLANNDYRLNVSSDMEGHVEEVRVNTGGTVMGYVRDAETGKGIAGVKLYVEAEGRGGDTVTGPDGGYIFMGLPGGAAEIRCYDRVKGYTRPGYELKRAVQVPPGGTLDDINLELEPAVPLSGVVTDMDGAPVKEAKVQVSANYNSASEETDALGRFEAPYFAEGSQVTVYASVDGMRSETQTMTLDKSGKTGLELKLTEKTDCAISGNVRTASGRVLRGARIIVAKEGETGSWVASEYASATGIFEIENLPAGTFVFMIEDQNRYQNVPCEGAKVTLEPGEHRENFELICGGQGTGRIAGRVIDHEGKPVQIAEVRVPNTALATAADAEGFFSIDGLEEEFVTLEVEPFRETPVVLKDVKVGTLNLVVKVLPRKAVRGQVVDASNRSPVAGARVRVVPQVPFQTSTGLASSEGKTDDQGQFEVDDMPQGNVNVVVTKAGFAPFNESFQNPEEVPVTVQLEAGGVLEGYVTNPDGAPVGGVSVGGLGRASTGGHVTYDPVTTDEKGYYKFDTVAPDSSVELSATHPSYVAGKATAEVVGLGPSRADITIGLSGTLTLLVTQNGAPVPADQMMVSLYNQYYDGNRRPTEPKLSEGMVVYDPLPPGKAQGSISLKLGEEDTARLHESFQEEVVAGQETVVEVAFETGTGAVSGTVVTPPGMKRVHVLMSRQGERETRSSQLLEGGSFLFEDLAPGDYSVRIIAETNDGKAMQRNQPVVVENGVEVSVAFDLSNSVNISGTVPGLPEGMRYHGVLVKGDVPVPGGDASMESLQQFAAQGGAFLQIMPDGTFESVGLEPGAYTVVVFGIEITGAPVNPEELSVEVMGSTPLEIPEGGAEGLVLELG